MSKRQQEESLEAKQQRHRALDQQIKDLERKPMINAQAIMDLKRRKLFLKDQIEGLKGGTNRVVTTSVDADQSAAIAA